MGDERPLADFIQSKYILLFGWNPTSAIKWVHCHNYYSRPRKRRTHGCGRSLSLRHRAKAHEWVSIRPATDGAMALAMGHVIVRDKLYDKNFVDSWTVGFAEYAEYVKDKTPEWAEKITTVPAATIERLAKNLPLGKRHR